MNSHIGDDYLSNTKYERGRLPEHYLNWSNMPSQYKEYKDAPRISLPRPNSENGPGIWTIIAKRRSVRAYTNEFISLNDLSQLLWATQGVRETVRGPEIEFKLRTAPSAGALYPIETYLYANRVLDLKKGIYHYAISAHELEQIKEGDFSKVVQAGALDQRIARDAAVVFIWSAVFARSKWKYLQRAYRYIFLDAGHIAQNLALAAEAINCGSCQIGAIYDDEMNTLLSIDGIQESVIYLSSVGKPRRMLKSEL
ncbi:SagB/ThcOx family dehydrogenase [Candidatus Thorarchaeota archaeon]|nr:MAG: SagB/ThcOx family dehydrogenase [Candidatus Thorarchaeota archaeon]